MDFDEAIRAHSAWKIKLQKYLNQPDGTLNASEIAQDDKCQLGEWIYGEGSKHSKLVEFTALKIEHSHFHRAAADIVRKADLGERTTEETALGSKSEFSKTSMAVVSAIMKMRAKA